MSITRVAKLAGVSSSTVSRVINRHPRVAPETALSVQKAMQQLGYTPSARRPGPTLGEEVVSDPLSPRGRTDRPSPGVPRVPSPLAGEG